METTTKLMILMIEILMRGSDLVVVVPSSLGTRTAMPDRMQYTDTSAYVYTAGAADVVFDAEIAVAAALDLQRQCVEQIYRNGPSEVVRCTHSCMHYELP